MAQDWQSIVKKYGPAIGKVETRDGAIVMESGSCFLIDENGRMLTNAHVVKEANFNEGRKIIVTFPFGTEPKKEYPAKIEKIAVENDLDLALLKVEGHFASYCQLASGEEPALMSEILVMGFPLGKGFKSTPGFIQAYQEIEGIGHMLDLSASVDFGNSGGPVFGKDGFVIGIVTAKIYGFNFNLAFPIKNATDFLVGKERQLSVRVTTKPDGARIFLNGIYRGLSPLSVDLFQRDYALLIEKDGYASIEKYVSFGGNAKPEIYVELLQVMNITNVKLTIGSTPPGARVIIDNMERGITPIVVDAAKGSRLRLRLLLQGYRDFYIEVNLADENEQKLSYTLEKSGLFW
jgi:hypothetical protein